MEGNNGHKIICEYTVPESLRGSDGTMPKKIGMRQLSAEQELLASKLGRMHYMRAQYAAIKLAIVELDGKQTANEDGTVDVFWDKAEPKLRSLLLQAYNKMTSPSVDEEESFFKSEEIRVG